MKPESLELTPHPVMVQPSPEEVRLLVEKHGSDAVAQLLQLREDKILAEKMDPYRHGYEPQHWKDVDTLLKSKNEVLVLGGNRAGKTEWAAKRVIQTLVNKPDARVWCLHTTNSSSIQMQQNVLWKYMPPELKNARKTKITNIAYSQKNGFSDNTFILPNRSQCFFMNYAQDKKVIEGGEVDLIWCDELVPLDWVETLRYRAITRRGKLIVTFTPVLGYSQVVKDYVAGCRFKKTLPASLMDKDKIHVGGCPKGHMPYMAESMNSNCGVIWFHSQLNPYNPFDQLAATLEGKTSNEVKIRAYGWAENTAGSQFPSFTDQNIVEQDKIPKEGTNFMCVDPAGARNWFMIWLRVAKDGNMYVYREWPDVSNGEWALPSEKADGKMGSGQKNGAGRGLDDYKQLIKDLEGDEVIAERYIDPRAGATQAVSAEGGTSLIELLDQGAVPMYFAPAAGLHIEQGVAIINDLLFYNSNEPISPINQPKLFVSDECRNLIYSMREWTNQDGEKGACKDPIDCLRYIAVMEPTYEGDNTFKARGSTHTY
jgi:phage terminase large subunit-like protein